MDIKSGKFEAGADFVCGSNVVIDVDEEVIVGDRCVIPDNAYLAGRRIEIGDDFYGFSWEWRRLEVGRGRRGYEHAVLKVGRRCTLHDNMIDLSRNVTIGDDVGLSPQVTIYTHGYWQSVLDGYPARYKEVSIGSNAIIGYRSVLLPGADVGNGCVVGAQSVVSGQLDGGGVYGGNPAKLLYWATPLGRESRIQAVQNILDEYLGTLKWRGIAMAISVKYPVVIARGLMINVESHMCQGEEDEFTDDLRDFLFRRGIRIYTNRPFKRLT